MHFELSSPKTHHDKCFLFKYQECTLLTNRYLSHIQPTIPFFSLTKGLQHPKLIVSSLQCKIYLINSCDKLRSPAIQWYFKESASSKKLLTCTLGSEVEGYKTKESEWRCRGKQLISFVLLSSVSILWILIMGLESPPCPTPLHCWKIAHWLISCQLGFLVQGRQTN